MRLRWIAAALVVCARLVFGQGAATITTDSPLPAGTVGQPYSHTLAASGGTGAYEWSVSGGALPPGVLFVGGGELVGIPTASGVYTFTVRAGGASKAFELVIYRAPLVIETESVVPRGTAGSEWSLQLSASGGEGAYRWALMQGSLPVGLIVKSSGLIEGAPGSAGHYVFTVGVQDNASLATRTFTLIVGQPPPSITTAAQLPGGLAGTAYGPVQLAAAGGEAPLVWSGEAPAGLTLTSGGALSGAPTAAGTHQFTVTVTDGAAPPRSDSKAFSLTVEAPLVIVSASPLADAGPGVAYSYTFAASGGNPPYTWSVVSGALPAGLHLESGMLKGTPAAEGEYGFRMQVKDSAGATASKEFALRVAGALRLETATLAAATVGAGYSATLAASGGAPPYTWALTAGQLPQGLALGESTGRIAGLVAAAEGNYLFSVRVSDSAGRTASGAFAIAVKAGLEIGTESPLPAAQVGAAYAQALAATGGTPPYMWTLAGGRLPIGLALNASTGTISGTAQIAETAAFQVHVSDAAGAGGSKLFMLTATAALRITTAVSLPAGTVGKAYSATLAASDGAPPYTWILDSGALPPGVSLNLSSGALSGTPTAAGTFEFAVVVSDSGGATAGASFELKVAGVLSIATPGVLPAASPGGGYSVTLAASGGMAPYRWAAVGALPSGLTLDANTGALGGSPASAGTHAFTVRVTDAAAASATKSFSLSVSTVLAVVSGPPPGGSVGVGYRYEVAVSGGTPPYTWSVATGVLPAGLSLDAVTGVIAGTAEAAAAATVTVGVSDAAGRTASKVLNLKIAERLALTTPSPLPDAVAGMAYGYSMGAAGGVAPYSWSVASGSLPAGMRLDSGTGALTGAPQAAGRADFAVRVTDAAGVAESALFSLTVALKAAPAVSIEGLPSEAEPLKQPAMRITLAAGYPLEIAGRVRLSFTPEGAGQADDRSIAFSDGSREAAFRVAANQKQAVFQMDGDSELFLQTGTVAGTITVSVTLEAGGAALAGPEARTMRIRAGAPAIAQLKVTRTAGGFEVSCTGYATTREVTQAVYRFSKPAGSDLQTGELMVPMADVSRGWYQQAASAEWGSQFTFVQLFSVQGTAAAVNGVSVTLKNSQGSSAEVSATF